jgi:hypothetical protein
MGKFVYKNHTPWLPIPSIFSAMVQLAPRKRKASAAPSDSQSSPVSDPVPLPHVCSYSHHPAKKLCTGSRESSSADSNTHRTNRTNASQSSQCKHRSWSNVTRLPPVAPPGTDLEDLGKLQIPSPIDPGPSKDSLFSLHLPSAPPSPCSSSSSTPISERNFEHSFPPFPFSSLRLPSLQPLISRRTLQKLDLNVILSNLQLRHDILFDARLQFRANSSYHKRVATEDYWAAIQQEIESRCTCVSFDAHGKKLSTPLCVCSSVPRPTRQQPAAAYFAHSSQTVTVVTPSRILPLLLELRDVLLYIIQPFSSLGTDPPSSPVTNVPSTKLATYSEQEAHIHAILDPELIEQELLHASFDPAGLFRSIAALLKQHCAPMRDSAIDALTEATCSSCPASIISTVRTCFALLELMKLDIANHELQAVRPALLQGSAQFELAAFQALGDSSSSLESTRKWLQGAHRRLLESNYPVKATSYQNLRSNTQVYLCVIRGFTDLALGHLHPSTPLTSKSSPTIAPISPLPEESPFALSGLPETTYLDRVRVSLLSSIATNTIVILLALLFHRQMFHSSYNQCRPQSHSAHSLPDLKTTLDLKRDLWEIWTASVGHAKPHQHGIHTRDNHRWRTACRDLALHVVARLQASGSSSRVPEADLVRLTYRWADENMHPGSSLFGMLRSRLQEAVFSDLFDSLYRDRMPKGNDCSPSITHTANNSPELEPLSDEIRSLSQQISKLVTIHANVYLPLYEKSNVLDS